MKKILTSLIFFILLTSPAFAVTTVTWLESGTDATQDTKFWPTVSGVRVTSDNTVSNTGPRSLKMDNGNPQVTQSVSSPAGIFVGSGSQFQMWWRFSALPGVTATFVQIQNATPTNVISLQINTTGNLVMVPSGVAGTTGSTVLAVGTWYRIGISFYVTDSTHFTFKVYINDVLELTRTEANGTLGQVNPDRIRLLCQDSNGADHIMWFDDVYAATGGADSSTQPSIGDIRVTNKRPFANGTTNGFTGAGTPSAYGTGNARYVNEQPLSVTNYVSVVAAGVTTEEYNLEGKQAGDVNLHGHKILAVAGWLYGTAALAETANMIIDNTTSAVALTSTDTMFEKISTTTTYPAGTGTDIGLATTSLATTVTLYETGVLIAYRPGSGNFFMVF